MYSTNFDFRNVSALENKTTIRSPANDCNGIVKEVKTEKQGLMQKGITDKQVALTEPSAANRELERHYVL